jgi:hypothetical protein
MAMRRILTILAMVALSSGTAEAISRYQSTSMSCAAARSLVAREGAVIFRYPSARNPGLTLYDRFVAHGGFCSFGEYAGAKAVPTTSGSCTLLACLQISDEESFFRQGSHHWTNGLR